MRIIKVIREAGEYSGAAPATVNEVRLLKYTLHKPGDRPNDNHTAFLRRAITDKTMTLDENHSEVLWFYSPLPHQFMLATLNYYHHPK